LDPEFLAVPGELALPEFPDLTIYVEALERRVLHTVLEKLRIQSPSLLRTVAPEPAELEGRRVESIRRLGKRIVFSLEGDLHLVLHLMIAGRLHWKKRGVAIPRKRAHAAFDFPDGSLLLTESSTKKRASLHLVAGREGVEALDPGGLEVFDASLESFGERLRRERHTLKRSLTDPHLFAGIGNAYSDEILHRAHLSPLQMSDRLSETATRSLFDATREVLAEWTDRLRTQTGDGFPEKVTAFRP
jgi:formamidopyrimidine-DNA glycosylase